MPRIPSAADVSPVGAGASRLPAVRADARDFGAAIGQGLQDFGEGLAAARPLVEELLRKEEQQAAAEESAEVSSHVATARESCDQAAASWSYDGGTPRQEAARARKQFASMEDSLLRGRPPERQARAKGATAAVREGFVLKVAQTAHNRRVEALARKTDETLQKLQDQAVRAPAAAEHLANEGTATLRSQLEAGALTAEQFTARDQAFRRKLFSGVIQGQAAADAVADLEGGLYDAVLGDPALRDHLLTQARWRLQSEAAQGQAAAQALVEAERRGAGQAVPRERTQSLLAAGDMADAELAAERARRVREALEPLRYAPEAAVQEAIAGLMPDAEGADSEERLKLQEEVRVQADTMLRARVHDPAAYTMDQPAVAEAFAAAARDPALTGDAVAARLAAQAAMGLPIDQRRALTRDESAEILASLDALPPAGRVAALAELGRRYGEQNGAIAAALMQAGLSPVEALLLDAADDPSARRALARLAAGVEKGGERRAGEGNFIAESVERLIAEGRQTTGAAPDYGGQPPEDMRLSSEWFRPKRNPLREDESLEGRLHIPKLAGTPREQAEVLMARLEVPLSPPTDEVAEDVLDLLGQLVLYRQAVRDEGLAARKRFRARLGQVGEKVYEQGTDFAFAPKIWEIANETIDSAYLHPWSLSNVELTSAIGAMAAKLREDADQSVEFEIISTLADLFLPAGRIARGIDYALDAIGLGDALTTSVAQKNIWRLINEATHRQILVVDPQAVKDAGL